MSKMLGKHVVEYKKLLVNVVDVIPDLGIDAD
jgi:hypothetical protein